MTFIRKLKVNLGLKVLSLLTAILFWFHVITERTYETTIIVPIQYIDLGSNLLITKLPPPSVKVKIRGKGKELLRFRGSAKILIDLSDNELGWKRIDLTKDEIELPSESKLTVVSGPTPKSFVMRVEEKVKKSVKVMPNLISSSCSFQAIPEVIGISGAASIINPISQISTTEIHPPIELPATLKVSLIIPEGVKTSVDSVTVILKSP
ncbi:MAG: hypothetical protein HY769_01755 [Candidatus Stahlbacteria bacterium]|nr:hypothetical protein [Candidatus Stahlbacteria bacterium]